MEGQHQRLQELFQQRKELNELKDNPGFKRILVFVEQQCRLRRMSIFNGAIDGMDKCFQLATTQGEVAGLQFMHRVVDVILADTDAEVQTLLAEIREKEGNSNGNDSEQPGSEPGSNTEPGTFDF